MWQKSRRLSVVLFWDWPLRHTWWMRFSLVTHVTEKNDCCLDTAGWAFMLSLPFLSSHSVIHQCAMWVSTTLLMVSCTRSFPVKWECMFSFIISLWGQGSHIKLPWIFFLNSQTEGISKSERGLNFLNDQVLSGSLGHLVKCGISIPVLYLFSFSGRNWF